MIILFEFRKRTLPIAVAKELEYLRAQADAANQNTADIAYVAMMSGINPYVGKEDTDDQI